VIPGSFRCGGLRPAAPLLIALALTLSFASADAKPRFEFEVSPAYTSFDYDEELDGWDNGGTLSFTAGAHVEFPLSPGLGLQTGLSYARYSNHVEFVRSFAGEFWIRQQYVVVPARLTIRPEASRRWYLGVGPQAGWLATAETEIEYQPPYQDLSATTGQRDGLRKWVLIGAAEGGTEFRAGARQIRLGLRYTRSVTPVIVNGRWFSDWAVQSIEGVVGLVW